MALSNGSVLWLQAKTSTGNQSLHMVSPTPAEATATGFNGKCSHNFALEGYSFLAEVWVLEPIILDKCMISGHFYG